MPTTRSIPVLLAMLCCAMPARAETPVLTLTGAVQHPPVILTRSDLKALPQHTVATSTSVTDGQPHFQGFLMRELLAEHGAAGDTVIALARNDYQIDIPLSDFEDFDVIGALYQDGAALSPRDKGPVWSVYPRDDHAELQDIRYDTRWVWQLSVLHVE